METLTNGYKKNLRIIAQPQLRACGYKTCNDFADAIDRTETELKRCIHIKQTVSNIGFKNCLSCMGGENLAKNSSGKTALKGKFDFYPRYFEGEPGPKRNNFAIQSNRWVKELGVKKGDVMIGRPMGMSCGSPRLPIVVLLPMLMHAMALLTGT